MSVDHEYEGPERLLTGFTGRLSIGISMGWFASRLGREVLPPLLPLITDSLSFTATEAGFALTLLWGAYAALQYPGGQSADQLSRTTVLIASLVVQILGFGVLSLMTTYVEFVIGAVLVGAGVGLFFISGRALLSDLFTERRGEAFGLQLAAGSTGSALAAGVVIIALDNVTWRVTFLPAIGVLVVVIVVVHRWSRESYVLSRVEMHPRRTGARLFNSRVVRRSAIVYSIYAFTFQATTNFLPTFLQVEKGFSPTLASLSFAFVFLLGVITGPTAGNLGDRFAHPVIASSALSLAAVGLLVLLLASSRLVTLVGLGVFASGVTGFPPVMQAYLMNQFPDASAGSDLGAFRTVYMLVGSLGPTYVGLTASHISYTTAYSGILVCLLAGILIVITKIIKPFGVAGRE